MNTATVDEQVLATSNGQSGKERSAMGSTSKGSTGAATAARIIPGFTAIISILASVVIFTRLLSPSH